MWVSKGSGCDGRPLGLTAGKLTSEVRCSEAATGGRVIPTHERQPIRQTRRPRAADQAHGLHQTVGRARRGSTSPPEPLRRSQTPRAGCNVKPPPGRRRVTRQRGTIGVRVNPRDVASSEPWNAQGPAQAALRDVMVAKSKHLRPPQDRHRSAPRAFETAMHCFGFSCPESNTPASTSRCPTPTAPG
jgi:hypothetical protein